VRATPAHRGRSRDAGDDEFMGRVPPPTIGDQRNRTSRWRSPLSMTATVMDPRSGQLCGQFDQFEQWPPTSVPMRSRWMPP
jgi:hypothetical protein